MFANTPLTHAPILFDTFVTLLIAFCATGLGSFVIRKLGLEIADRWERGLFASALGLGLFAYVPFAMFAAGLGQPRFIIGALLLVGAAVWPDAMRAAAGAARGIRGSLRGLGSIVEAWPIAAMMAFILIVTFLKALCPPTDPDGLHYHLLAPLRYLAHHRFYYMPTYLHVNWPLGVEMLFALGMSANMTYAAGLVQFMLGCMLLLMTARLGLRLGIGRAIWPAMGLLLFAVSGEMSWAYIDLGLAFYSLAAIYAFVVGESQDDDAIRRRWWTLAALLAGCAATAKLSGLLCVLVLAIVAAISDRRRSGVAIGEAARIAAIGLAVVLPWYIRCWAQTGDPFYPYLYSILGDRDWSPNAQRRFTEYFQALNSFHASRMSGATVYALRAVITLVFATIGAALACVRSLKPIRSLALFGALSVALLTASSGIYLRFFLPWAAIGLLVLFYVAREPLQRPAAQWVISFAVVAVLLGLNHAPTIMRSRLAEAGEAARVGVGLETRDTYLVKRIAGYSLAARICNEFAPDEAVIVMALYEGIDSLVDRETLTTSPWTQDALRYDSVDHLVADLKRLHATHLIWHPLGPQLGPKNREDSLRANTEFTMLDQVRAKYGVQLATSNGYELYALMLPGAPPPKFWKRSPIEFR